MQVSLPALHQTHRYLVTSASKTVIGNKTVEFMHDKLVSMELVEENGKGLAFRYGLLNQHLQGSSLIHHWTTEMDLLLSNVIFITDRTGRLTGVHRFPTLRQKFENEIAPIARAKYPEPFYETMADATMDLLADKNRFLQSFQGYSAWRFFFNGWFRKYDTAEEQPFSVDGYFGKIGLPLLVQTNTAAIDGSKSVGSVLSKGRLDKPRFDAPSFARMLKDLTGIFNTDSRLEVEMEEQVFFLKNGSIEEGEFFLQTSVPDWYSVTTAHQIRQLNEDQFSEEMSALDELKKEQEALHGSV